MLKDYQKKILELLEQLELELSDLYRLFADKYPARKDLWETMVVEEIGHADRLKMLSSLVDGGQILFEEKMIRSAAIQSFIDNIRKIYSEAQTGQIPLMKALVITNDFEQSIIEKKFYDHFIARDPGTRKLINDIRDETNQHSLQIRKAIAEEKNR